MESTLTGRLPRLIGGSHESFLSALVPYSCSRVRSWPRIFLSTRLRRPRSTIGPAAMAARVCWSRPQVAQTLLPPNPVIARMLPAELLFIQKCQIRSAATIKASFLLGGMTGVALKLPLKAGASSAR